MVCAMFANKLRHRSNRSLWIWPAEQGWAQRAPNRTVFELNCVDCSKLQRFFKRETRHKTNTEAGLH